MIYSLFFGGGRRGGGASYLDEGIRKNPENAPRVL